MRLQLQLESGGQVGEAVQPMQQREGKGRMQENPENCRERGNLTHPEHKCQHPEVQQQEREGEIPHQPAQRKAPDQGGGRTELLGN